MVGLIYSNKEIISLDNYFACFRGGALEWAKGWILVDQKSNPGGSDRNEQLALEHGPQLAAYAEALVAAKGASVAEQWLYLPVAGRGLRLA